jgi:predicted  nucleic acid-binding Zn-ribbon protein
VIELNALAPWAAVIIAAASLLYAIFSNRSKDQDKKFASLGREVDSVKDRVAKVENDLTHLPDKSVTHRLELHMAEMKAEMAQLTERMKPISAMASRIQDAVLEKVMKE